MLDLFRTQKEDDNTPIDRGPVSSDDQARLQHYSVFLLLGIPTMLAFGLYNFLRAQYLLFSLILLSATGLVIGWLFLRRHSAGRFVYRINTFLFSLLILYMLLIGGEGGSKILWMYTFPLISFFLLGKNEGLFWSMAVVTLSILLFWNPFEYSIAYEYSIDFKIRFVATYLIVSAVTYWFETFRYRYRRDIEQKTQTLQQEIAERKHAEQEQERLIDELQKALDEVKTLSGFLPICASCKKIRDDQGYWKQIESYLRDHSSAKFSHSICPECNNRLYPGYLENGKKKKG